jgi:CubicO group peptidase (beta-lactamase class C family)
MEDTSNPVELSVSTPEAAGVPSRAILKLLERLHEKDMPMHGFLAMRGGNVIAEGYWKPYRRNQLHRIYSSGKSFVSIAIGFLAAEGVVSLDDKIVSYFPEKLPEGGVHPYIADMTVRDLLMMASAYEIPSYSQMDLDDWVRTFFMCEPSHIPGTVFSYDTSATLILTALVEKKMQMTFLDYLRPRLLNHLGFSKDAYCIKEPGGVSHGGSGMMCTLRDLAKVAFVCLRGGKWNGKQLIPEAYLKEATSKQITTFVRDTHMDSDHGYGYQFWCYPHKAFAFLGMGGQLALCFPEQDFLLATVGNALLIPAETEFIHRLVREEILPYIDTERALPADPTAYETLQRVIENLTLHTLQGGFDSALISTVNAKTYRLDQNPMSWETASLTFSPSGGTLHFAKNGASYELPFGYGENVAGSFPEIDYDCLTSAAWWNDRTLNIACYITGEYEAPVRITVNFKGDAIAIQIDNNAELFIMDYKGIACGRPF